MADAYIGQIVLFAGPYVPVGWALCDGTALPIIENQALYSVIGITYGGDGVKSFNLPNLIGRAPVGTGAATKNNPSIIPQTVSNNNIPSGQTGGSSTFTLTQDNLAAHSHPLVVASAAGSAESATPVNNYLANTTPAPDPGGGPVPDPVLLYSTASDHGFAASQSIGAAGSGTPTVYEVPYIAMNYIIALQGSYPTKP